MQKLKPDNNSDRKTLKPDNFRKIHGRYNIFSACLCVLCFQERLLLTFVSFFVAPGVKS